MAFLEAFLTLLSFLACLLLGYLGDALFRLPNGLTLHFRSDARSKSPGLFLRPWFSFQVPSFIGIILAGVLTKNFAGFLLLHLKHDLVNALRIVATVTIIYKIGLGLDLGTLRRHKLCILALSLVPNLCEALYVAFYSWKFKALLAKEFAFCLGFEVSGASTAILMPILLGFQKEKLNQLHGVPSILLAASVLDNVFSIFAFNFARTLALSPQSESFLSVLVQRLWGLGIGLALGVSLGLGLKTLATKTRPETTFLLGYCGGVLLVFWLDGLGFRGAGFVFVFVSTLCSTNNEPRVEALSENVWGLLRLYLFFFIGISIDLRQLDLALLGEAVLLVISSSAIRALLTLLVLGLLEPLSKREVVFGAVTWIAKASLQAALGTSLLFESVSRNYGPEITAQALVISQISICYILITGPMGAVFLSKYGRNCLETPIGQKAERSLEHAEENLNLIVR